MKKNLDDNSDLASRDFGKIVAQEIAVMEYLPHNPDLVSRDFRLIPSSEVIL